MDRISNRDIHTNCQGNIYLTYNISTKTQKPYKLIQERMLQAWNGTKLWSLKDKNMKHTVYHQMVQSISKQNCTQMSPRNKICACGTETYFITWKPEKSTLAYRNELISVNLQTLKEISTKHCSNLII